MLQFPGTVDGPWGQYVVDANENGVGQVRFPRKVPRDSIAAKLLAKRTLTELYNSPPTWLDHAHRQLNEAVCAAYSWDMSIGDLEMLDGLLVLNLERQQAEAAEPDEAVNEELDEDVEDSEDED